jgi:galacturan 1,4-alpha-galacturonidase
MLLKVSIVGALASLVALLPSIAVADAAQAYSGPKSPSEFRNHHPYHNPPENHRQKIHIRSSKNDTDDISADFYNGLKKANNGGTLVLPKGQTFVIAKKLDLTFLENIEVQLDGEILVISDFYKIYKQSTNAVAVYKQYHLLAK